MFISKHSYVLMNPIKLHYQSLKSRDRHTGGFHVFCGSVCCLFDNLRCSRCGEVVDVDGPLFFTDCHITYNQFILTRVPVIAVQP